MKQMNEADIQSVLESGKLGGKTPFAVWLRIIAASADTQSIARALREKGILSLQWGQDVMQAGRSLVEITYLAVGLPNLHSSANPSQSLSELAYAIACELRNPYDFHLKGTELRVNWGVQPPFHRTPQADSKLQ
jgi:hypothetical protein